MWRYLPAPGPDGRQSASRLWSQLVAAARVAESAGPFMEHQTPPRVRPSDQGSLPTLSTPARVPPTLAQPALALPSSNAHFARLVLWAAAGTENRSFCGAKKCSGSSFSTCARRLHRFQLLPPHLGGPRMPCSSLTNFQCCNIQDQATAITKAPTRFSVPYAHPQRCRQAVPTMDRPGRTSHLPQLPMLLHSPQFLSKP